MNRRNQIRRNLGGAGSAAPTGGTTAPGPSGGPATGLGQRRPAKGGYYNVPRAAPKAQPSGPPAPQGGGGSPMPWDIQASNDEANAYNTYNKKIAGLDSSWVRAEQNYGLEGPWADYKANPYSEAALLQRSYENAQRGTLNSAGMQLYSGSTVNHHNANTYQLNLGRNQLEKRRQEALAQNEAEKLRALEEREGTRSEADWKRIEAGLKEPEEAAAAPARGGNKNKKKGGKKKR